ncbi:MAG: metal-sensing transcriptional repressor [Betaproteobacteria bacterium]
MEATKTAFHLSHPDIVKRLRRAEGHLRTIVEMMESHRPCVDVAQQLHAVERAVCAAKKALIHDHIDHCLEHANRRNSPSAHVALGEFKEITKYL